MSKKIDIEYCGSWGYEGYGIRLKNYIINNYGEGLQVVAHYAQEVTGTIKVSWVKEGQLITVW